MNLEDDVRLEDWFADSHRLEDGGLPEVRLSDLKSMALSPAHFKHRRDHRGEGKKRATSVGTVAHAMLLGGEAPVIYPGKVRNGKKWEAFRDDPEHAGRIILIQSEYDAAVGCARSVEANREAMELLEGEHEAELPKWSRAGRACGGRPDVRHPKRIVELKTSVTSDPMRFPRLGQRMGYHAQLAWYLDGWASVGGTATEAFIVAVETTPPYVVTIFELTERALDQGRRMYSLWFEQLLNCEASDTWPPYAQSIVPFDVPEEETEFVYPDEELAEEEEAA